MIHNDIPFDIPLPEPRKPDYAKWVLFDFWSLSEAAHLLAGIEPGTRKREILLGISDRIRAMEDPLFLKVDKLESFISRAVQVGILKENEEHIYPGPLISWAMGKRFDVPDELKSLGACGTTAEPQDLTGEERRALGNLRMQKEKWDASIRAAVHGALFCQNKRITRDALKDELFQFRIPDTSFEIIWKALRDKGLTHGGGRPKKGEEEGQDTTL